MVERSNYSVFGTIRRLLDSQEAPTDGELLERYRGGLDQMAFAALVRRHGNMVWGVCRHVLRNDHDAEDAFQTTFAELARQAGRVNGMESVGGWLHGTAHRTALMTLRASTRRRRHETDAAQRRPEQKTAENSFADLQVLLDGVVARLPEKYRTPFVLCCLEGKSIQQAAQELDWKQGTVCGRLATARQMLQRQLVRRGMTLSAALTFLAVKQTVQAQVSTALIDATVTASCATGSKLTISGFRWTPWLLSNWPMKVAISLLLVGAGATFCIQHGSHADSFISPPVIDQAAVSSAGLLAVANPADGLAMKCDEPVTALVFSPDSRYVVSGGETGEIRVWDLAAGKCVEFKHDPKIGKVLQIQVASSRKDAAVNGQGKHNYRMEIACLTSDSLFRFGLPDFDVLSHDPHSYQNGLGTPYTANVRGFAYIADSIGTVKFTYGHDDSETFFFSVDRSAQIACVRFKCILPHYQRLPETVRFSDWHAVAYQVPEAKEKQADNFLHWGSTIPFRVNDGSIFDDVPGRFVTAKKDGSVAIRIVGDNDDDIVKIPDSKLPFRVSEIRAIYITKQDTVLVATSLGTVHELSADGKEVSSYKLNAGEPLGFVQRPTKPGLIAVAKTGGFELWDVASKKRVCDFGGPSHVKCLAASYDGRCIASADGRTIRFWDAETGKPIKIGSETLDGK